MPEGLLSVENYKQMKTKISAWVFGVLLIELMVMKQRGSVPFSFFAKTYPLEIDVFVFEKMNTDIFLFPLLCAAVSFITILHTKIDKIIRVRKIFEYRYIFSPMVQKIFGKPPSDYKHLFEAKRSEIMAVFFYNWASSTDEGIVQKHNIHEALTNWSWLWISTELIVFNAMLSIISYAKIGSVDEGVILLTVSICVITWISSWRRAKKLIKPQIRQIYANQSAISSIRSNQGEHFV